MDNRLCMAAALLAASIALPAHGAVSGFTGSYAPGTWTTSVSGNLTGAAGGSASVTAAMLTLTGGNDVGPDPANFAPACIGAVSGVPGACQIQFVTTNVLDNFVFDWAYVSNDSSGAGNDLFGVLIDGVRTQLSDPGGAINQSGHLLVGATSSFGWYVNCTDCIEGAAVATITNFQAGVVPEPGVVALLGAGLVAGGVARSRRRGIIPV